MRMSRVVQMRKPSEVDLPRVPSPIVVVYSVIVTAVAAAGVKERISAGIPQPRHLKITWPASY